MSGRPENFKRKALDLDPKAYCEAIPVPHTDKKQWRIYDGAGVVIGYTDPRYDRSSRIGWMRAYYTLDARRHEQR